MSARHLLNNAKNGNFEAAVQVFLNYRNGAPNFEKSEELALQAFEKVVSILESNFYLNELAIFNFKKISELHVNFDKNLTVFIGENGVGKTSLLESIRKNLMWIAGATLKKNSSGGTLDKDDVNNKNRAQGTYIDCEFEIGNSYKFKGRVARAPDGFDSDLKSELTQYRAIGKNLRTLNEYRSINLPLLAFYGIDRLPKDGTKSKISDSDKIDGYDGSLKSKASFNVFIEWLVKQLKISKSAIENSEKLRLQKQLETLLQTGADKKESPLYELYENLNASLNQYSDDSIKNNAKATIESLEKLFRNIYPDLSHIELINEDDGEDKVMFHLKDEIIFLHQVSDGQRVLFGLIGDIARRLLLLNDESDSSFNGKGIVLIDEIELHLHPSWQQKIILILRESFPNIQFIVTTHSPHVLTTVEAECIRSIYIDPETNTFKYEIPRFTKGAESNVVLEDVFYVDSRPQDVEEVKWLDQYITLVNNDKWDSDEAKDLRTKLDRWGKNKETELDKIDIEISLRAFKRSKK